MTTPKKHNKNSTEKLQAIKQEEFPTPVLLKIKKSLRTIWVIVTVVSVLLNFYFALSPQVSIDYASDLIPENPLALPIKITNNGHLTIHVVKCIFTNFLTNNVKIIEDNQYALNLATDLRPGKSTEFTDDVMISTGNYDPPIDGVVSMEVQYQLPLLSKLFSESRKYRLFKNKDGSVRWSVLSN